METQKSLLRVLAEWWEQRQTNRRSTQWDYVRSRTSRWLPTPGSIVFTLLMMALLLWAQTAGAIPLPAFQNNPSASTGTIAYQGRLADTAGSPLTAVLNMEFRLYDAPTGGVPLWEELWTGANAVQVSDGLFNVMLGSLSAIPQSIVANHASLYLGITAGTDDEMTPRVQLGSVPFAVQALTVPDGSVTTGKIADEAVTQAKLAGDISIPPPDASVTTAKLADGAVTSSKLGTGTLNIRGGALFGVPESHPYEGGEIQLAEIVGGSRYYLDNFSNYLRWFACRNDNCPVLMTLDQSGSFWARGTKSALVSTDTYGMRKLYAVEAADVRFSDEGLAQLESGTARISLDPVFLETVEGDYVVHVTPYGNASVYVAELGKDYFVVTARDGDPNTRFAWRLSAIRKGYAETRLEEVQQPTEAVRQ